jgi:hypothetical protein
MESRLCRRCHGRDHIEICSCPFLSTRDHMQQTSLPKTGFGRQVRHSCRPFHSSVRIPLRQDLPAQLRSETNTAVVSAGTVAAPVFELNVDSRVAVSLEFCWTG